MTLDEAIRKNQAHLAELRHTRAAHPDQAYWIDPAIRRAERDLEASAAPLRAAEDARQHYTPPAEQSMWVGLVEWLALIVIFSAIGAFLAWKG